jgi:hypothetical protein
MFSIFQLWQDYIRKVPVILRGNRQRESHIPYGLLCLSHTTTVTTQAGDYWRFHRSDCKNTMIYAHTISGILLTFDVILGSLEFPAIEVVDFVELILL